MNLTPNQPRPEVAGRLKLAERHQRIADQLAWYRSLRRRAHLNKAQKHRQKAERLAAKWRAAHPGEATQ